MAKAIKYEVVTTTFVLELSKDEAETLKIILMNIGGSKTKSRRRFSKKISQALDEAGCTLPYDYWTCVNVAFSSGIEFRNDLLTEATST